MTEEKPPVASESASFLLDKAYFADQVKIALTTFAAPLMGIYTAATAPAKAPTPAKPPEKTAA